MAKYYIDTDCVYKIEEEKRFSYRFSYSTQFHILKILKEDSKTVDVCGNMWKFQGEPETDFADYIILANDTYKECLFDFNSDTDALLFYETR